MSRLSDGLECSVLLNLTACGCKLSSKFNSPVGWSSLFLASSSVAIPHHFAWGGVGSVEEWIRLNVD